MKRRTKYLAGILALIVVAAAIAISTALASTPTSTAGVTGTAPFTFTSAKGASNPTTTVLELDGLVVTAKCSEASGKPELQVKASTTIVDSDLVAAYSVAGYTSAWTTPLKLESTAQPLFGSQETGTDGTQLGGTFTYTSPEGHEVTANYQWWVGDEVKALNGVECLFSGNAVVGG
jgi:hypothetical protein